MFQAQQLGQLTLLRAQADQPATISELQALINTFVIEVHQDPVERQEVLRLAWCVSLDCWRQSRHRGDHAGVMLAGDWPGNAVWAINSAVSGTYADDFTAYWANR